MARILTPEAALSYPHLFEADEKGKFSVALVFPAGTDLKPLKQAALNVVVEKFGKTKAAEMLKKGVFRLEGGPHHSIRTDVEAKGYPEGTVGFINARGNQRPGIVGVFPDTSKPKNDRGQHPPLPITDPTEVYAGVIARASVTPYWYDVDGNRGVAWGLNNIQILRDGDRLDGRVKAEDEFDADMDAVASLEDLTDESGAQDEVETPDESELDINELLNV